MGSENGSPKMLCKKGREAVQVTYLLHEPHSLVDHTVRRCGLTESEMCVTAHVVLTIGCADQISAKPHVFK
jgi:hypothetical protein